MGEAAADARRQVERNRDELDGTITELRGRADRARGRVRSIMPVLLGAVGAGALTFMTVLAVNRRRGGKVTRASRRLPQAARPYAVPAARAMERWTDRRARWMAKQRDQFADAVSVRLVEQQAAAERKANPVWRRAAVKAVEVAAATAAAELTRRTITGIPPTRTEQRDRMANPAVLPEAASIGRT